jgi:hypothetical protein
MKLNSCVYNNNYRWLIITATSSFVSITYHSDELCKYAFYSPEVIPYKTDACVDKVKTIISPTAVVASTNATSSMK